MSVDIDVAQARMNDIIERFRSPDSAQVTTRVEATLRDGLAVDVAMRGHRLLVDEPKGVGGGNEGPNPVELVLAALTTCQVITYRVWASKLGIALDDVRVEADGDIDLRGFFGIEDGVRAGYSEVRLRVTLSGPETVDTYQRLSDAVDRHCPVLDFATAEVPVERVVVIGS